MDNTTTTENLPAGLAAPAPSPVPPAPGSVVPPSSNPKMVNISTGGSPQSFLRSFFSSRSSLFLLGGLFVLLIGLGVSVFLVRRQQSQNPQSQATAGNNAFITATGCNVAPGQTSCQGSYSWNFDAVFGTNYWYGIRIYDQATGTLLLSNDNIYALWHSPTSQGTDCTNFCSGFPDKVCGYPNCKIHQEDSKPYTLECGKNYVFHFLNRDTTNYQDSATVTAGGCGHTITTATCQMVSPDKDLTTVKIGDTVKFTGYGSVSSSSASIDKINFILLKDSVQLSANDATAQRAPDKDTTGSIFYVATQSAQISSPGNYSMRIKIHRQGDPDTVWEE